MKVCVRCEWEVWICMYGVSMGEVCGWYDCYVGVSRL